MQATREAGRPRAIDWADEIDRWRVPADTASEVNEGEAVWSSPTDAPLAGPGWPVGLIARLAAGIVVGLILIFVGVQLVDLLRVKLDDWRYGRPRTSQLTAFVGHGEADGAPTHLIALNLNRRIVILEIPGGDPSRTRTISGPVLVGKDEELAVATMRLADVNGDSHPDLLLRVKNEELVLINERGEFRAMTRAEKPVVERALGVAQ